MAQAKDWPSEPFNGLNSTIQERIRHRYQASNAEFCRTFWPDVTWTELFEDRHQRPLKTQVCEESDSTHAELLACRQTVLTDSLPPEILAELPR